MADAQNSKPILFKKETRGQVKLGVLTFQETGVRNAFSKNLVSALEDEIRNISKLAQNNELSMLVFYGGKESFSAGSNLKERKDMSTSEVIDFVDRLNDLFDRIERLPLVTVAAIQGYALGGGFELALACDMRFAAANAVVGLSETGLGIIPGAGGTYRMLRVASEAVVKASIFMAKRYKAKEAEHLGLVSAVFPDKEFLKTVCDYLFENFNHISPFALLQSKRVIEAYHHHQEEHFRQIERSSYLNTLYSQDRIEGLNAFQEKRSPEFTGDRSWTQKN